LKVFTRLLEAGRLAGPPACKLTPLESSDP
jgi:hypothetical protein